MDDGAVVGQEQTDLRLNSSGDSDSVSIASLAPAVEGVYEIRCRLFEKPDRIWSRLTGAASDLASVKTPLLIYSAEAKRQQNISPEQAESSSLASQPQWHVIQTVQRVDPNDWQTPAWIPDRATSLVPNVKRVSDSLTINPWREEIDSHQQSIAPGESFVGWLPGLSVHQPYQMTVVISQARAANDKGSARPPRLRIEFSNSPAFGSISQSLTLSVKRQLDLAAGDSTSSIAHGLLHYAAADSEFVRLTNESTGKTLLINSVTLAKKESDGPASRGDRSVTLQIDSADWIESLSADYWDLQERGAYADSTVQFFRLWKSISRLPFHARWCGYDEIIAGWNRARPIRGIQSGSAEVSVNASLMRRTKRMHEAAFSSWVNSNDAPVINPLSTETPSGIDQANESVSGSFIESRRDAFGSAPSFQMLETIAQKNPGRLLIRSSNFPMTFDTSYREGIEGFKLRSHRAVEMSSASDSTSDPVYVLVGDERRSESGLGVKTVPVTIINTGPWSSNVRFRFSTGPPGEISILRDAMNKASVMDENDVDSRTVSVPPSSIVNLLIRGGTQSGRLKSWHVSMVGGQTTMETLKDQVSDVIAKIGTLALPEDYDQLRNGGFEVAGKVGIVGWMHTQFPATAVMLDSEEAIEGSHSIRMTADSKSADRTWLVSEPIQVPDSGRLAVSLSTRANVRLAGPTKSAVALTPLAPKKVLRSPQGMPADDTNDRPVHRVRVSLEGNRLGKPVRFVSEFDVPCDGQWQPRRIVLETDEVRAAEIASLRLTVDSLSPGKLWIDDVHLHDQFPTQAERTAMQGRAFLAVQGLQHGHLKPAAQLLQNDWSKYLLEHSPPKVSPRATVGGRNRSTSPDVTTDNGDGVSVPSSRGAVGESGKPPAASEKKESVADRIRHWLPRPIRF